MNAHRCSVTSALLGRLGVRLGSIHFATLPLLKSQVRFEDRAGSHGRAPCHSESVGRVMHHRLCSWREPHTCNMTPPNEYTSLYVVGIAGGASSVPFPGAPQTSNSGAIHCIVPRPRNDVAKVDPPSFVNNIDSPKSAIQAGIDSQGSGRRRTENKCPSVTS